jgi:hypothetical protein
MINAKQFKIITMEVADMLQIDHGKMVDFQSDAFSIYLEHNFGDLDEVDRIVLKRTLYQWWLRIWFDREEDLLLNLSSSMVALRLATEDKAWKYYTDWHNPMYIGLYPPKVEMEGYYKHLKHVADLEQLTIRK